MPYECFAIAELALWFCDLFCWIDKTNTDWVTLSLYKGHNVFTGKLIFILINSTREHCWSSGSNPAFRS